MIVKHQVNLCPGEKCDKNKMKNLIDLDSDRELKNKEGCRICDKKVDFYY